MWGKFVLEKKLFVGAEKPWGDEGGE